jgi:sulfatase maturation enzyme AslB (radical SAM superfamily)
LLQKNQQPTTGVWRIEPQTMDQQIDYDHAKVISFRGGEPFLSKTNFYILKKLIEIGNTDCFITFQTNGSIVPTSQQLEILSHFKNVNISLSLDGTGPVFEYLRYPLKWADIENTIDWYRKRNFDTSVAYTLSNLNVLYHAQTTAWFEKQNLNYLINQVYSPAWFRPSSLPESVKNSIEFDFVNSDEDSKNYSIFREIIAEQDSWKGIRMQDYLPELCDLLG